MFPCVTYCAQAQCGGEKTGGKLKGSFDYCEITV